MMRFEYQFEEGDEKIVVELPSESTLEEALDAFGRFLRAATYNFTGDVIIYDSHVDRVDFDGADNEPEGQ